VPFGFRTFPGALSAPFKKIRRPKPGIMMILHAFNQRILAEDLVRIRRPDDRERYAAAQRQARIDPNPTRLTL
jgi:hypothetical protein